MFDIDGRRTRLKQLMKTLDSLGQALPSQARPLRQDLDALRLEVGTCLGAFKFHVKADRLQGLEGRTHGLRTLADGLLAMRREADELLRAERAGAQRVTTLEDAQLRDWFLARSRDRADRLEALGMDLGDARSLDEAQAQLDKLDKARRVDRFIASQWMEAGERLRKIQAEHLTRDLAAALPELRRSLLEQGPSRAWGERIGALLSPLKTFVTRDKPPQIDEVFGFLVRMEDWNEVMREDVGARELVDASNADDQRVCEDALRDLTNEYFSASGDWQNRDDEVFADLLERAQDLERRLVERVRREHTASVVVLERNRNIFEQFAEPDLSPGLSDTFATLLSQTPDSPEGYSEWRSDYHRANDAFEGALGNDSSELARRREQLHRETLTKLGTLASLYLDPASEAEGKLLERELRGVDGGIAEDAAVTVLIDALETERALSVRVKDLCEAAGEKSTAVQREQQDVNNRARRLADLAGDLELPISERHRRLTGPAQVATGGLDAARVRLEEDRRLLAKIEPDLLDQCCAVIAERLDEQREIRRLLEDDLAVQDTELRSRVLGAPPQTLEDAEAALTVLPHFAEQQEAGLQRQIERLVQRRGQFLEQLAMIDCRGMARADRDAIERVHRSLEGWGGQHQGDLPGQVRFLRNLIRQAEHQTDRVEQQRRGIEELARRLQHRFASFRSDYFEVERHGLVDRVWALIQPVDRVSMPLDKHRRQLEYADILLRALERHARRLAAGQFAEHWRRIADLDDPEVRALAAQMAKDSTVLPDYAQRFWAKGRAEQIQ